MLERNVNEESNSINSGLRAEVVGIPVALAGLVVLVLVTLGCGICVRKKRINQTSDGNQQKTAAINPVSAGNVVGISSSSNLISTEAELLSHDYSVPADIPIDMAVNAENYSYARTSGMYPPHSGETRREPKPAQVSGSSVRHFVERDYEVPSFERGVLFEQILEIFKVPELERHAVTFGRTLGEGNFGTVCEGQMVDAKGALKKVAIKTLKVGSAEEDRIKFLQEAAIMAQFKHPNVVKVRGVVTLTDPILIVLELLSKGDLSDYLKKERMKEPMTIDANTLLSFCRQVAAGMVYLSNKSFVHRDLAARNVLLSEYGVCKIADFGLSRDLMDEQYYVSKGGKIPVKWTAPEALHYKKYSTASDVWSYGIMMYEIWSVGRKPYEAMGIQEVMRLIDMGYRLPPPTGCPRSMYEAMIYTWHPTTSERPTFEDLLEKFSMPDSMLLEWSKEDGPPTKLGELVDTSQLYEDLQYLYSRVPSN